MFKLLKTFVTLTKCSLCSLHFLLQFQTEGPLTQKGFHTLKQVEIISTYRFFCGQMQLRARLDCLTKPCDIIHVIDFSSKYCISQMDLSDVYTVCLTFSLLWETQIVHTKLGIIIKKQYYF